MRGRERNANSPWVSLCSSHATEDLAWQAIPARQLGVCLPVYSSSTMAKAQHLEDCLKFWAENGGYSSIPQILCVSLCGGWDGAFPEVTPKLLTRHPQGLLHVTELASSLSGRQAVSTLTSLMANVPSSSTHSLGDVLPDLKAGCSNTCTFLLQGRE